MRSPSTTSPSSQHSQPRLELLGHFDDFITSDSSAESASDELEEFKPPPGERTRRVSQLNRVVRPRRLAALRNSVTSTFCQQQQLRRNSPRKKSLLRMGAASAHPELDEPKKSSTTGKTTAPKNASNTTTPKRSTAGVVRKSSSIGSSSSSQDSSSLLIGVNVPTLNVPVSMLKRGEHFSTAQRRRGQLRGVGRLFSLQMATSCCVFNDCSDASRPSAIARSSTGSRRLGRARRSRGGSYTTTPKVLEQSEIPAVDGDGAGMEKGRVERGQHQRPKRGGRRGGGRGGPRGERQQRIAGSALILEQSNYDRSKGQVHEQYSSSSAESSSEEEDNARVGRSDKKLPLTSAEDEVELSSSSSSTTTDEEEEEEEEKVERPRGNLLGMVSPPHVPLVQQRQQIPYYSPPLVASTPLFQSRRKKNPNSKFVMLTGTNHQHPSGPLSPDFDYTNPYETSPNSNEFIDPYQRKMRDALITYRFLGYLRPLWGPFMLRNLHYMRCMRPPRENFNCHNAQLVFSDNAGGGIEPIMPSKFSSDGPSALLQHSSSNGQHHQPQQQMDLSRTSSRISNKFPATIRPSFIRNNLFFGKKKAIVHCFHVSECNGRLSPMKLIPSATFEMKVNERIRNISIDLPDGMHLGVLDGDKANFMAEYLVVRVVFRFEDAEIGGRHLRKVPSRLSSSGTTDCSNQQHCLRKNGPADDRHREVVMFGAKRIFSFNPGGDLKVINDETSIDLFSDAQLQFSELNSSKLSAAQLSRLIHGNLKPLGGSSPFITVRSHGDSDDDDEEEDEQEQEEEGNDTRNGEGIGSSPVGNVKIGPKLKKRKIGVNGLEHDDTVDERQNSGEGLSLREALEAMDMADNNRGTTTASSTNGLLELPKVIGLKFWLHSPCTARGAVRSSASQLPPGSPPGQQRRRLFFRTAAAVANISLGLFSADERPQPSASLWDASSSSDSVSSSFLLNAPTSLTPSSSSAVSPPFVCRPFPTSHCFFCLASLRVRNLWALQKHLTFCHPRFDFSYETSIRVSPTECLPGFSITQNVKFDSSNELRSARTAVRPTWLVTKALANKMRTVDNFPIERYTAVASGLSTAEEYIRTKGRFNFETPARIDQPWMRQMSIRKLNDITDLHPAECAMMQMWNTFLLRIRITLFGRRMLYKALRVFVKDSRDEIDRQHLRTHFLLHLTCLLNAGGIDEEERYDLYRRLEHDYDPCGDSRHFVGRELKALEKELRTLSQQQQVVAKSSSISKGHNRNNKIDILRRDGGHQHRLGWRMELRHQQQNSTITATTRLNGSTFKKTAAAAERLQPHRRLLSPSHNVSSSSLCGSSSHFNSCQELRERFAFASSKRIALLWKFLQNYDCPADDFNAYTTNNALPQQKTVAE